LRSGISYPSYLGATYTMVAGVAMSAFPVQNLDDKISIRKVFKANSGPTTIGYAFAAGVDIQFIGILHHNAALDATYRHQLYAPGDVLIYDSGVLPFFASADTPLATFALCVPHVLPGIRNAVRGTITLSDHATGWQIGGVEVAGWWEWTDVTVPRQFGIRSNDVVEAAVDGADATMAQFKPRIVSGTRGVLDATVDEDMIARFQRRTGTLWPFVWLWDYDDPDTWPRECFLVRNDTLPPLKRGPNGDWPEIAFSFAFLEHLR
jgi:hypothetical protein